MTSTDLDMAAIMAKANDALAQPAQPTAAGVLQAHQCQTGCGRIANVVMIRLADSDLDIMCDVCALMMWLAVAQETVIPEEDYPAAPAAGAESATAASTAADGVDNELSPADNEQRTASPAVNPE